ncbi:MAG TPA: hypothetical protein PLJ21_07355 [Pseudobdellovibrionaceae bacterium]|nr:hypothetical protein [Pseudobdellovibrionaceae bacterium]
MVIKLIFLTLFLSFSQAQPLTLSEMFWSESCFERIPESIEKDKKNTSTFDCYDKNGHLKARLYRNNLSSDFDQLYVKKENLVQVYRIHSDGIPYLFKTGTVDSKNNKILFTYDNKVTEEITLTQPGSCQELSPLNSSFRSKFNNSIQENLKKIEFTKKLNLKIDPVCDTFLNKKNTETTIRSDYADELYQGMTCLKKLNGPLAQQNLDLMERLFFEQKKPINITCANNSDTSIMGLATLCGHVEWPTISIAQSFSQKGLFFHETFHLIDPNHYHFQHKNKDLTIACTVCCFQQDGYLTSLEKKDIDLMCKVCEGDPIVTDSEYLKTMVLKSYDKKIRSFLIKELAKRQNDPEIASTLRSGPLTQSVASSLQDWSELTWSPEIRSTLRDARITYLKSEKNKTEVKVNEIRDIHNRMSKYGKSKNEIIQGNIDKSLNRLKKEIVELEKKLAEINSELNP